MNQFCLGKTLGEMSWRMTVSVEKVKIIFPLLGCGFTLHSPHLHRQNKADRLQSSGRKSQMLVEKCGPLGVAVLIEILKLRNARMKVIIVVPAEAGRPVLWLAGPWLVQVPCLDSQTNEDH